MSVLQAADVSPNPEAANPVADASPNPEAAKPAAEAPTSLLDVLALACELATSPDPESQRRARALIGEFPGLPGAGWIAEFLNAH